MRNASAMSSGKMHQSAHSCYIYLKHKTLHFYSLHHNVSMKNKTFAAVNILQVSDCSLPFHPPVAYVLFPLA